MPSGENKTISRPGYEYLIVYMLAVVLHDLTVEFCAHFLKDPKDPKYPNRRYIEQMEQASRSIAQNIAEGYTHESLKGYIFLTGIAHGSNEELALDFADFLRQRNLPIWERSSSNIGVFRDFRVRWVSENTLNTPNLPTNAAEAGNMLLTFCNMESFLLTKHLESIKEKHKTEGGLTEKLYKARKQYRGY